MAQAYGFRKVKVFENVTANTVYNVDNNAGSFVLIEVTNDTASTVYFEVNENIQGGRVGVKIPIMAGTTRTVPMSVYSFKASDVVTVVAYGM